MVTWLAPEGDTDEQQLPGSRPLLGEAAGRLGRQGWRGFAGWESGLGRLALLAQGFDHTGCFGYRRGWRGSQGVCRERKERQTHTEGQPPGVIFPGSPSEAPSTRASFSPSTISRGKHPLPPKTFQAAVSVESPSKLYGRIKMTPWAWGCFLS